MTLVGLSKKAKGYPDEYFSLTELQQTLYRVCLSHYQRAKERIDSATTELKVRDRIINKSEVARIAAIELGKKSLNHSHMSHNNCPFLFNSINAWNAKLEAAHSISPAHINATSKELTKEELKQQLSELKTPLSGVVRDVYDYYVNSCLLDSESELKSQVDKLKKQNIQLREKLINTELAKDALIEQLASTDGQSLTIKQLQKEILKLRSLLNAHDIEN